MKKALVIISAITVVIVIILFLLVRFYVTPERVKEFLIPAAEEALNRKVDIDEINISLFKGIEARNFSIKEADGSTDFLKSKEFVLKYKFLPLLSKNIIIDELRIISPEIRIVRDRHGKFNFESIGEKKTDELKEEKKEEGEPEGLPVSLLVSRLVIDDAGFYLNDHKEELPEIKGSIDVDTGISSAGDDGLQSEGSIELRLDRVVLKGPPQKHLKDISAVLKYAVIFNPELNSLSIKKADLKVQDISASITGDVKGLSNSPELNIAVSLPETNTESIMKLAAPFADTEGISISGAVSSDLKVKGLPDTLHAEGHITLAKINAVYKDTQAALDGDLNFKYKPGSVHINKSSLTIQKIPVSLKGNVTGLKKTPKIDIDLSIAKSNAANLVDTKDISLTGDIKADLNLRGMPSEIKTLKAGGNISLINMGIKYKDINAMINSSLALKSTNVQIKKADLKVEGVPVSAAGSVKNIIDSPSIDLSVSVPKTEASALQKLASNFTDLKDISLSGRLGADLRIKGRPEKIDTLKATGNVKLEKVGVKYNKIDAVLNGGLKIGEKLININLSTTYGRNSMQIKGTVANYFKNQDIKLNVYSKKLFIDELEPLLRITDKPSEVKKKTPSKSTAKQAEPDPVDLKLTASGEVKVNAAVYKGMDIKDFVMKYRFKDNWLNLTETGKAGKGSFNIKTLLNLSKRGYGYTMTGNIDSLHAEEIVNAFFPKARNKVFGIITSNLKLSGQGTLPENMKKHLKGSGNFHIKKGRISNAEIARELSLLVNIGELETIEFTKAEGTVNIGGGIAELNSIFTSNDISMDPKGNIGLDETLDLAFDLKLSPRLTDKAMSSKISQYIRDKGGWGTIPLLVTGSLSSPKYRVDVAKVGKKVIEKEVNKLLEKLINKGRDKERPKQPQEEDRTQEPADPLKDILKQLPGLFE
jgi:uncharacterized protein involved in outer membrane biogenesis